MRIFLQFESLEDIPISYFLNKFSIQGMWYNFFLKTSNFKDLHNKKGLKFFCFSDVFKKDNYYNLIFSSPIKKLVEEVYEVLKKLKYFYIGNKLFEIKKVKKFDLKIGKIVRWITGSPVVVYYKNKAFSFLKDKDYLQFFERLKENSIKKFETFYNEKLEFNEELFDKAIFGKSLAIQLKKDNKKFLIFASTWKFLEKRITNKERKFYKFLLDCGIGEKNSLGFGFVNPLK